MSRLTASAPVPRDVPYRPMSLLAVLALGLSLASLLVFLDQPWLLVLLSIPALVMSIVARRRIRRSEGTLAGELVAAVALGLSIISTVGFAMVHITRYWVIRQESAAFVEQWFQQLAEGREGLAFLATVDPRTRQLNFSPDDTRRLRAHFHAPGGSLFDVFRGETVPAVALRYGKRVEWQMKGILESGMKQGNYYVVYLYHLNTPTLETDVKVSTLSQDVTKPKFRREWRLDGTPSLIPETARVTPYGIELDDVMREAVKAVETWVRAIGAGNREFVLAMLPGSPSPKGPADFEEMYQFLRLGSDVPIHMKDPVIMAEEKDGNRWTLRIRAVFETTSRESECLVTITTPDWTKGPSSWRMTQFTCKSMNEKPREELRAIGATPSP